MRAFCFALFSALLLASVNTASLSRPVRPETTAINPAALTSWTHARLADARRAGRPTVVIDVRSASEFAVGRIPGATHIEPGSSASQVRARLRNRVRGAAVVFYCTLGPRSRLVAERVSDALRAAGATDVATLDGGIVAWANADRPMRDARGPTPFVHPHDRSIATQLSRPGIARFEPRP
jgi:rhodanese-related sulfurtransferase